MRYKYFYNPNPTTCPICKDDFIIDTVYNPSYIGLQNFNDKLVWCCPEQESNLQNTKICFQCGQPIHIHKSDILEKDDTDYFYIYMNAFIGWRGSADPMCIALNLSTGEAVCSIFEHNAHREIRLNHNFCKWLRKNYSNLLHYKSSIKESNWCDVSIFWFQMMTSNESNKFSFQSPYMEKHPLFQKLVELILKTFQEKENR